MREDNTPFKAPVLTMELDTTLSEMTQTQRVCSH